MPMTFAQVQWNRDQINEAMKKLNREGLTKEEVAEILDSWWLTVEAVDEYRVAAETAIEKAEPNHATFPQAVQLQPQYVYDRVLKSVG